jgi:hypothetical protein
MTKEEIKYLQSLGIVACYYVGEDYNFFLEDIKIREYIIHIWKKTKLNTLKKYEVSTRFFIQDGKNIILHTTYYLDLYKKDIKNELRFKKLTNILND